MAVQKRMCQLYHTQPAHKEACTEEGQLPPTDRAWTPCNPLPEPLEERCLLDVCYLYLDCNLPSSTGLGCHSPTHFFHPSQVPLDLSTSAHWLHSFFLIPITSPKHSFLILITSRGLFLPSTTMPIYPPFPFIQLGVQILLPTPSHPNPLNPTPPHPNPL